jgi:hypothetical protein
MVVNGCWLGEASKGGRGGEKESSPHMQDERNLFSEDLVTKWERRLHAGGALKI